MSVFASALRAGLPLLAAHTTDTVNIQLVLSELASPRTVAKAQKGGPLENCVLWTVADKDFVPTPETYGALVQAGTTMVVVNPSRPSPLYFDCGTLPVPASLVHMLLSKVVPAGLVPKMVPAFGGMTLKDTGEAIRLTAQRDGAITYNGIMETRQSYLAPTQGLTLVPGKVAFYQPNKALAEYITRERDFFFNAQDLRLMPRGLLFDGPPGTGKTEGAKYIARSWGVPLYRLDLGTVQNKYLGESEAKLSAALSKVDQEEPCIVLLDEVEKHLASSNDGDSGVRTRLLSQLLWWLAEHRSRVFTVMTCNNLSKVPPEVYRDRRIDQRMTLSGLQHADVPAFANLVARTFFEEAPKKGLPVEFVEGYLSPGVKTLMNTAEGHIPQATVTQAVIHAVKVWMVDSKQKT